MSEENPIVLIRGSFNATDALCVVASLTGDPETRVETEIIYPYYCFDTTAKAPGIAGRKGLSTVCLVDAVNGVAATADSFELKKESVAAESVLPIEIDEVIARELSIRTVTHNLGRKFRTIASFDVETKARGLVHKRFWVVHTSEARLLVDSTTAGWHPLKLEAA